MITATRKIRFCAGHIVTGHESKCANFHGHDYTLEITAKADELDDVGRVIDFGVIKEKVGKFVDDMFDHKFMIYQGDPRAEELKHLPGFFLVPFNPTAENIAHFMGMTANEILRGDDVTVIQVRCWETPNCYADWWTV